MKVDRRGFIKEAGVLAALAGGAMAGLTARCYADGGVATAGRALPWLETDVLVVGGGPAGVCAAIAAARNGAKVIVVERGNCLGGMATRGLVGPFMTCYGKSGGYLAAGGPAYTGLRDL